MGLLTAIPIVGDLVKTVFGSQEKRDQYQADARSAVYQQFAAEFGHGKTWWDSLIDGLNRLPRPLMTFGTIYLFWLCWRNPAKFMEGAAALQAMPKEGWYILGAVVTFWFAAKLPSDFGKYKAAVLPRGMRQNSPAVQDFKSRGILDDDPQEGSDWQEKVESRYKPDWDNLNS